MKYVKFMDENGDEHRIPTNQVVHVPSCGWVSENVAPSGSGRIEMGLPTCVVEVALAPGLRLEVELKEYPYGVEIVGAQIVEECADGENDGRFIRQPDYPEGCELDCGCVVYRRSEIMSAILGLSCPDCYDRMMDDE